MIQHSEINPNLSEICGEVFKRLENSDSRKDCVKEILESKFDGKMSEQDYIYYQFVKVLNEMYKEGFNAGKNRNGSVDYDENNKLTIGAYLNQKVSTRKAVSDSFAMELAPIIKDVRSKGAKTLQDVADKLTELGIKTLSGYDQWHPASVRHIEKKIAKKVFESNNTNEEMRISR